MAEALGLLGGGWDRDGLSSGTIRSDWVARLSKGERLLDRACFLLKQSIAEVGPCNTVSVGRERRRCDRAHPQSNLPTSSESRGGT